MKYLMKMQLGPVQDFIVQAKSTRDMWAGSYMLSWLTASLMKPFEQDTDCKFVFPALEEQPLYNMYNGNASDKGLIPTLPNVFMLLVPEGKLEELVNKARESLYCELSIISRVCWNELKKIPECRDEWKHRWDYQVNNFFQITWHAVEYNQINWKETVLRLGVEMAGRRNTRDFEQWGMEGAKLNTALISGSKDVLSGKEEIIGDEDFWNILKNQNGLYKQFTQSGPFAAINCIKRLMPSAYLESKFKGKKQFWENMSMLNTRDIAIRNRAGESDELDGNDEKRPANGYFAVIAMDGDKMGAALQKLDSFKEHRQFSTTLAEFSTEKVNHVAHSYPAQVVYAGGDDVLVMVSADSALKLAKELAECFRECMKLYDLNSSCGIAVAHYKFPLQHVVMEARRAEKRAKEERGRNAFSLSLIKRSGETIHWGGKWDSSAFDLYKIYTKLAGHKDSSSRFPYALSALLQPYKLEEGDSELNKDLKDIMKKEYQHIRAQQELKGNEKDIGTLDKKACEYIDELFEEERGGKPDDFAKLFLASAFMNRLKENRNAMV